MTEVEGKLLPTFASYYEGFGVYDDEASDLRFDIDEVLSMWRGRRVKITTDEKRLIVEVLEDGRS